MCFIRQHSELPYFLDIYYLAFVNDPPTTKILVYTVYAVELAQTISCTQMAFKDFVTGFGRFETLTDVVRLLIIKLVAFAVQIFYAYRIRVLIKSNFIPVVVALVNTSFFIVSLMLLFLYVLVCLGPTRRRNRSRCNYSQVSPSPSNYGQEDNGTRWCTCCSSSSSPSQRIYQSLIFLDLDCR